MIWGVVVLGVVLLLLSMAWFLPVTVEFQFERKNGDDEGFVLVTYLFGLIRIRHNLQAIDAHMTENGPAITVKHQAAAGSLGNGRTGGRAHVTAKDAWQVLKHWRMWFAIIEQVKPVVARLFSQMHILTMRGQVVMGTGDAVTTGIACGAVWGIVEPILGKWTHVSVFESPPFIRVEPDFKRVFLSLQLHGIIKVRAGYAISGGIRILRILRIGKRRASHGAPHTRSHADRHG